MKTWQYLWQLATFRPQFYIPIYIFKILIFCVYAQAMGMIFQSFFDSLTGHAQIPLSPWLLIALVAILPFIRAILVTIDIACEVTFTFTIGALLRQNLLSHILKQPGARAVPGSPGEAISRFRDDIDAITDFMDQITFYFGYALFCIIALIIMVRINPFITCVVFLPLVGMLILTRMAMKRIVKYRQASRQSTGAVTSFVGEMFGTVQAIQFATAEERVTTHFRALNETRRQVTLKDTLFSTSLSAIFANTANLGTGLVLLLAGQLIHAGTFTVGDFALFVYYLSFLTQFITMSGTLAAQYKQLEVSFERLSALLQNAPPSILVQHNPLTLAPSDASTSTITQLHTSHNAPSQPAMPVASAHPQTNSFILANTSVHASAKPLIQLEVSNLSYRYPDTTHGIENINFTLSRGSFTVITGRIGSGKTTLLRVLLGLLTRDTGTITWNGQKITDPASFFIPPHSAYTPQVPLLFTDTLRDNILMGLSIEPHQLQAAIQSAVLERDLESMKDGLETPIGRKGVKLSGGQMQRTAAARMFVRMPELLVFDDLSSSLDVETENLLWQRLSAAQTTSHSRPACLVVSHRHSALRHADNIIVLQKGSIVAIGSLNDLLRSCPEMQNLWQSQPSPSEIERMKKSAEPTISV